DKLVHFEDVLIQDSTIIRLHKKLAKTLPPEERRNVRKRTGNTSTGRLLTINGESLALFQNMGNEKYVKLVFGTKDLGSTFGKYRKLVTKKKNEEKPDLRVSRQRH
ncbi:MAG: hypothetical protein ACP5FQ_07760, partial [Thermoplasmata archaeon]